VRALQLAPHAEEAASAAVSKHGQRSTFEYLGLHELRELALQSHVVAHVELFDSGAGQAGQNSDQVQLALRLGSGDLLSGKHVRHDRPSNLEGWDFLAIVFDGLMELNLYRCGSHCVCSHVAGNAFQSTIDLYDDVAANNPFRQLQNKQKNDLTCLDDGDLGDFALFRGSSASAPNCGVDA
jgi:hypothetical protein